MFTVWLDGSTLFLMLNIWITTVIKASKLNLRSHEVILKQSYSIQSEGIIFPPILQSSVIIFFNTDLVLTWVGDKACLFQYALYFNVNRSGIFNRYTYLFILYHPRQNIRHICWITTTSLFRQVTMMMEIIKRKAK